MGLDLDVGAEFGAQRRFQPIGDLVRRAERQAAVDLQIERDRQPPADRVHRDVMHRERAIARDHHHALEHGLVARARAGRSRRRPRPRASRRGSRCSSAVLIAATRSSGSVRLTATTRSTNSVGADRARPHALDRDHAADARARSLKCARRALRRGVGQGLDGAPPEPPARDQDERPRR